MIVSEDITLELDKPVTNEQIIFFLNRNRIDALRWAIVNVKGDIYTLRISREV